MPDTPYGVTGCRCWLTGHSPGSDDGDVWNDNPHCPYHGLLPRDRTDTGVYRVVRGDDGKPTELKPVHGRDGEPVIPPSDTEHMVGGRRLTDLDERLRRGIEQAERGETVDRGDFTPDCEEAREEAEEHSCAHEGCTGEPGPDSVDHRLDDAAERVARVSEGLNQRLAGCTCGGGSTDRQRSCPRHGYDGDVWAEGPEQLHAAVDGGMGGRIACACGDVWPCPVAKGPRCKGRGYCVYHDVPTVHDIGPLVAQTPTKKPGEEVIADMYRQAVTRCDADTDGCNYQEPHKHGFACDKTCDVCHGHYDDIDPDAEARGLDAAPGSLEWFAEERRRRDAARAATAKHLASGALRPALTAEEEKYYWLIHKPAWWRRLFRR